jgi:hypothetical protein
MRTTEPGLVRWVPHTLLEYPGLWGVFLLIGGTIGLTSMIVRGNVGRPVPLTMAVLVTTPITLVCSVLPCRYGLVAANDGNEAIRPHVRTVTAQLHRLVALAVIYFLVWTGFVTIPERLFGSGTISAVGAPLAVAVGGHFLLAHAIVVIHDVRVSRALARSRRTVRDNYGAVVPIVLLTVSPVRRLGAFALRAPGWEYAAAMGLLGIVVGVGNLALARIYLRTWRRETTSHPWD